MATLPPEILDLFIDFIDDSPQGHQALRACMLVSKLFFLNARGRLFSTVKLYHGRSLELKSFKDLLEYYTPDYSPLSLSIRALEVVWDVTAFTPGRGPGETDDLNAIFFLLSTPTSNIHHLRMNFSFGSIPQLSPHSAVYRAWVAVCALHSLKSLSLQNVYNFPISVFDISHLSEFEALMVTFRPPHTLTSPLNNRPPKRLGMTSSPCESKLRKFVCVFAFPLPQEWLALNTDAPMMGSASRSPSPFCTSSSPFTNLRSLIAKFKEGLTDLQTSHLNLRSEFHTVLSLCQRSLEHLQIHVIPDMSTLYPHSLEFLGSLRTLTYVVFMAPDFRSTTPFGVFQEWICESIFHSISTIQTQRVTTLQQITIHFIMRADNWLLAMDGVVDGEGCSDAARNLLNFFIAGGFNSGTRIDIIIYIPPRMENLDTKVLTNSALDEYTSRLNISIRTSEQCGLEF